MERTSVTAPALLAALLVATAAPSNAGVIYLTAESGGFSHLHSYDTVTGVTSDCGIIQGRRYTTDLAYSPEGDLYGVGWANSRAGGTARLFTIDPGDEDSPAGWSMETVKSNRMDRAVNSATFDDEGSLYVASAFGSFQKLEYDATGDRWNVVRSARMVCAASGDLAFGADGSDLYVSLRGGKLGKVDFDAGSGDFGRVTVIGHTGYANIFGLAMVDGILYGTTAGRGNYDRSYLVEIDPDTAAASQIAYLGTGVWGAAGVVGEPVPEPSTLALIALGCLFLPVRRAGWRRTR
ncbi:MAG: PEP-CTERM sorting domain-containing protein [Planctomycetota bacterium]|jgi:hypothetical protein